MKLTGSRIDGYLKDPASDTLGALVYGPDRGLVVERANLLSRRFVADPDDAFAVTRLTTDDLSDDPTRLHDAMTALSLLGDASLVRLRLDHERQGRAIADLVRTFDTTPALAASKLVIEGGAMKTGSAIRKAIEASRHFAALPCYPDGARDTAALITAALEEDGLSIRPDALGVWMDRLDSDRALVRSEIEKMILYVGPGSGHTITVADVDANTAGAQNATLDQIVTTVMGGDVASADSAMRRAIAGKTSPILVLISLQRHLLRLIEAASKVEQGMNSEQALKSLRPPVFYNQLPGAVAQLNRWSKPALQSALSQSLDVETRAKTAGAPVEALISRFALALASFAAGRK